jgi:hypothetical protein
MQQLNSEQLNSAPALLHRNGQQFCDKLAILDGKTWGYLQSEPSRHCAGLESEFLGVAEHRHVPVDIHHGRYAVSQLMCLSLSIAVLGAIWAFFALSPLSGFVLVWAGFIAWGCFFHTGGDNKALVKTIAGTAWGALVAWIALLIIVHVPVAALGAVWPALVVGVTVFFLVIVASAEPLSAVPANVYGYAALVGYSLHQPSAPPAAEGQMGTGPLQNLTTASFANPLILLIVSFVIGALLGYLSGQLSKALASRVTAKA